MVQRSFAEASSAPLPLHNIPRWRWGLLPPQPLPCRRTERVPAAVHAVQPASCPCRLAASTYQPLCSGRTACATAVL